MRGVKVALAPFLADCDGVITLGVRQSLADYHDAEKKLLQNAERIFFPTARFVDLFRAANKWTFPETTTYHFQRSRLAQHNLFSFLDLPRPRACICYGRHKRRIQSDFTLPLWISGPRNWPHARYYVESDRDLKRYMTLHNPVIVEQFLPYDATIQLLAVNYEIVTARSLRGTHGAINGYEKVSVSSKEIAIPCTLTSMMITRACLDDIVVEWSRFEGRWLCRRLLRPPARWRTDAGTLDRHQLIGELITSGRL